MGEAKARRAAGVFCVCFESSFGRASEGKYEARLTMARRYNVDCVERDGWLFWYAKLVLQDDQRNGSRSEDRKVASIGIQCMVESQVRYSPKYENREDGGHDTGPVD